MNCPKCGYLKTKIVKCVNKKGFDIRYRKCPKCLNNFKTKEMKSSGWRYESAIKQIKKIIDGVT